MFTHTNLPLVACIDYGDGIAIEYLEKARAIAKTFFQNMDQDLRNVILPTDLQSQTTTAASEPPSKPDMNTPQSQFVAYHMNNTASLAAAPSQDSTVGGGGAQSQLKAGMSNGTPIKGKAMPNGHPKVATANGNAVNGKSMSNGLRAAADDPHRNPGEIAIDVLEQFATDILEPLGKTLMDKLGTDLDDLIDLIKHGSMEKFWTLIADAADTVISVVAQFVDGFLKFCEDIVNDIKDLLTEPLEIPFFTELYEFICKLMGYDEDFTLVNAVSFLVSIPMTTFMKIGGFGTIMDHNDIVKMDDPNFAQNLVSTVQGALAGPQMQAVRSVPSKSVHSKAPKTAHLLAASDANVWNPPDAVKYISGIFGVINAVAAMIYNGMDFSFLIPDSPIPLVQSANEDWKKKMKMAFSLIRLVCSAPMPKADVVAQAYEVRWVAWLITNGWRVFINVLKPGSAAPFPPVPDNIEMPSYFEYGGSLGVNVAAVVMAAICDAEDDVSGLTWAGDMVSNTGGTFSSLGKMLAKDVKDGMIKGTNIEGKVVGIPMIYAATFVSLGGNVCSGFNAGGAIVNAATGRNVWVGLL